MSNDRPYVRTVGYDDADEGLKRIYDAVRGPNGDLDNLYRAFSLVPHSILPADDLYRAVLHHEANQLPRWFSELLGTYVAVLAGCDYAAAHHGSNYEHLVGDKSRAEGMLDALRANDLDACGDARVTAALRHTRKLCETPQTVGHGDHRQLVEAGFNDTEIVEIVQVVATFSYFVRVINGLGISLAGEKIGLY